MFGIKSRTKRSSPDQVDSEVHELRERSKSLANEIDDLEKFLCKAPEVSARQKLREIEDMNTIPPPDGWEDGETMAMVMPRRQLEAIRRHRRQSFFIFLLVSAGIAATAYYLAKFLE